MNFNLSKKISQYGPYLKKTISFKFLYNCKYFFFNIFYYLISKFLNFTSKKLLYFDFIKKIEMNIFSIEFKNINAIVVARYMKAAFKARYTIWEIMRPVLIDLNKRMTNNILKGFKITVCGRFKRAQRATFWWRKEGMISIGEVTAAVDYYKIYYRTKYGMTAISVGLTQGSQSNNVWKQVYPFFNPFFFKINEDSNKKIKYFILKKNELFFKIFSKRIEIDMNKWGCNTRLKNINLYFVRYYMYNLLYKNLFINMFLYKIGFYEKNSFIGKFNKIFLPQYCLYKIYIDNLNIDNLKLIPFITLKYLKRINIRNSYKVKFIKKLQKKRFSSKIKILLK